MGRLHVKFHQDRCKGEAVMRKKPFYLTAQSLHCDLDLWPFDPKVHRAHTWLMGRLHVKFHEDRCRGEAFMRLKPFYLTARLQTDGRTDRRTGWFQYTPPNFIAGGIMMYHHTKLELPCAIFHKNYMDDQSCIVSTFMSINIVQLFRWPPKMQKL